MTPESALDAVTDLRSAAFDLLEAAAHRDLSAGTAAEAVDHLQIVANELGAVERLLGDVLPAPMPGELRRRRYAARAGYSRAFV